MDAEKIEWLRGFAAKHGCKLEIDGQVGFGRKCVGILFNNQYLTYSWYGMEGDEAENKAVSQIVRQHAPEDAYHKDDCIAVLGEGFHAIEQLYDWCYAIDQAGLKSEETAEADLGPGTMTMTQLMTGRRGTVRRFCR